MHILVIGGTGRTGQLIIAEALFKGHQITALVRNTSSLAPQGNLTIIRGTPLNPHDIATAFTASPTSVPTAIIVALNARRASDSPFAAPSPDTPPRLMADSVANAIAGMKAHGASRIVIMSSQGAGTSFAGLGWMMRLVFSKTNMKLQMEDHDAVDAETRRQAGVDFVMVRPVMLAEGPAAPVRVYGDEGRGIPGFMPKITRASIARFMVEALDGEEYVGRAPVISN
ncbi:Uu.00g013180.m01.CDS01 [Anthostomella pinea]|uniref:Uu.00g013180.m01.CDS01 n=1 Tax=Anthostomella pinea TaxID=933095 RepID=A0AAI8VYS0_9PEZI|nr:Uu.00g013180.m01.CDS01 [Anthostomella pinea]